jgi:hypothetical protein
MIIQISVNRMNHDNSSRHINHGKSKPPKCRELLTPAQIQEAMDVIYQIKQDMRDIMK